MATIVIARKTDVEVVAELDDMDEAVEYYSQFAKEVERDGFEGRRGWTVRLLGNNEKIMREWDNENGERGR